MSTTRLFHQLYLTIFGALLFVVVATIAIWQMMGGKHTAQIVLERVSEFESRRLLSADSDRVARRQLLGDISTMLDAEVALFGADNRLIDAVGRSSSMPHNGGTGNFYEAVTPALGVRLSNGGWIEVRRSSPTRELFNRVGLLAPFGIVMAVFCYPVVRRLTRRLERLQSSVESLGSGDLKARVKVEGCDEVARLAQSFNSAAAQIEMLVGAHKLLLANVSHELRTPLSRLRLTAELLKEVADPKRKADLEKDITEIDALIEQILLSSRLDAVRELDVREEVDLLALAAEEGARCAEFDIAGDPVVVCGDPTLLRRLIRNLIENAHQHGSPPVEIRVRRQGQRAVLTVSDGGPGISLGEQERVFAPFYRPRGTRSQGSGLGLALVRQIARQHGGGAAAAGSETCPSMIEVTIPADDSGAVRSVA
jgi:signal transduction histidine kinase